MKTLLFLLIGILVGIKSMGQRYEVWVQTVQYSGISKANYGFSNDSILMTWSNPSIFYASKEKHYRWDEVAALKIRNKSRHTYGQWIGFGAGILVGSIATKSMVKSTNDKNLGMLFVYPFVFGGMVGAGVLAGHLLTSGTIVIPLNGKSPKEKNQLLRARIKN